jgi:hypothetical protein
MKLFFSYSKIFHLYIVLNVQSFVRKCFCENISNYFVDSTHKNMFFLKTNLSMVLGLNNVNLIYN